MLYLFFYLLHAVAVVAVTVSVVVAVIGNLPKTSTRTHQILKQYEACIVCIISHTARVWVLNAEIGRKQEMCYTCKKHIFRRIFNFWTMYSVSSICSSWCKFIRASRDNVKTLCSLSLSPCCSYKPLTDTFYALQRFSRIQMRTHTHTQWKNSNRTMECIQIDWVCASKWTNNCTHETIAL